MGVSTSRLRRTLNAVNVDTNNPLIVCDLNRCVACGRCVRVCQDIRGVGILGLDKNEEDRTYVGVKGNLSLEDANCRFCGACVEVCPTGALQDKKDIFKEGNRNDVLIPCKHECPAGINVPKYVRFIKEGNFDEAATVIREKAPFPKSLGLVCMRFCESGCRRKDINGAVSIRDLKRFAAEKDSYKWKEKSFKKKSTNKRVAVIGSGPAGLTASYYLAKLGHTVDVYEKLPIAGGMLSAGIPDYRLPKEVVESEMDVIREVGVNIITNSKIEELAEKTGIDKEGLVKTINDYNEACKSRDNIFNKDPKYLKPLVGPKYYALKFAPSAYGSAGGIKINYKTQAVDAEDNIIPGLFAAGIDANSLYNPDYAFVLPGNSLGFALNSGRMAGENAVQYIKENFTEE